MFNTDDLQPMDAGQARMSERLGELAKTFLSALFMGLRTAKIHSENNQAYEGAIRTLYDASRALYSATEGFRFVFMGDTVLVNDTRLRLDAASFSLMRSLRTALEGKKLGGLAVQNPPTFETSRQLIELLRKEGEPDPAALARANIIAIAPQAYTGDLPVHVDPAEKAVRAYAKLLIAVRTQFERFKLASDSPPASNQIRLVRTVQDAIEVCMEVPQVMLRMSHVQSEEYATERYGANVCVLSVCMGQCLGLDRPRLVDLGVAAALHHLGIERPFAPQSGKLDADAVHRGFARSLSETVVSTSMARRALLMSSFRKPALGPHQGRAPDLLARVVGLTSTYVQLVSGYGLKRPVQGHPLDVMTLLERDDSGRFDPELVDLLMNLLRLFPVGVEVVLASGTRAVVTEHEKERPWDRPVVEAIAPRIGTIDLIQVQEGAYVDSIVGSGRYMGGGATPRSQPPLAADPPRAASPLTADLETLDDGGHESLRKLPPAAEDLLRDFLEED